MNEQLRKAIEEATEMWVWREDGIGERVVSASDSNAALAKFLRVIELLVQQRDEALADNALPVHMTLKTIAKYNTELIAALEGK